MTLFQANECFRISTYTESFFQPFGDRMTVIICDVSVENRFYKEVTAIFEAAE